MTRAVTYKEMSQKARQQIETITQVAENLFARESYEKVTIKEVAENSGVSVPIIYRHFGAKVGLYRSVYTNCAKTFYAYMLDDDDSDSIIAKARGDKTQILLGFYKYGKKYMRFVIDYPVQYSILFNSTHIILGSDQFIEEFKKDTEEEYLLPVYKILKKYISHCMQIDTQSLSEEDVENTTLLFWGAVHGLSSLYHMRLASLLHKAPSTSSDDILWDKMCKGLFKLGVIFNENSKKV